MKGGENERAPRLVGEGLALQSLVDVLLYAIPSSTDTVSVQP